MFIAVVCLIKRSVHLLPSQAVPGKMDSGSDPERCSECSDVDDDGESSDADDDDEGSVSDASSSGGSDPSATGSTDTGSGSDDSNEATAEQRSEPNLSSECEEVGEVEAEHKEHCTLGAINCPRCRWIRHRVQWRAKLTFRIHDERGSWVEECVDVNKSWGLGCKVCRWAGESSKFARGEIRCIRATRLYQLMRHGNHTTTTKQNHENRGHARALRKLARKAEQPDAPKTPGGLRGTSRCARHALFLQCIPRSEVWPELQELPQ